MENHHFKWENPLLMAIFNSYVKLPEGIKQHKFKHDHHTRIFFDFKLVSKPSENDMFNGN
jgi:hypothetical protein